MICVEVVDGPPGSGKTSEIVARCREPGSPRTAVVTFGREAAHTLLLRAPEITAGTIYSLTRDATRPFWGGNPGKGRRIVSGSLAYQKRAMRGAHDPAVDQYMRSAPSAQPKSSLDSLAARLHEWPGPPAPPPFDLAEAPARGPLQFILPIARWIATEEDLPDEARYARVFVDEAQDLEMLELAAALRLVRSGGTLLTYGDPGQAIFVESKTTEAHTLPAPWRLKGATRRLLTGGHRCGQPLADAAARVLSPIWKRPGEAFAAPHRTSVAQWWPETDAPPVGLILGYSRKNVVDYATEQGIRNYALVPSVGDTVRGRVICTGHAAKGAQADNVYLLPWSDRALKALDAGEPGALRLLYTMMTRARSCLFLPASLLARVNAA
jgi:hypothetical protein